MSNELHNLVSKINNTCKCDGCGGRISGSNCAYCKKDFSDTKKKEIDSLSDKLHLLLKDYSFSDEGYSSDTIYELYRISDLKIDFVDGIVKKSNYDSRLFDALSSVLSESINLKTDSLPGLDVLEKNGRDPYRMLMYFVCDKDPRRIGFLKNKSHNEIEAMQLRSALLVFRKMYNKEFDPKNDTMTKELYSRLAYLYAKTAGIVISSDFKELDGLKGLCKGIRLTFSNDLLDNSYEEIFNTIFHEIIHRSQHDVIGKNKMISNGILIEIKDRLLEKQLGKEYYQDNYCLFFSEQEAFIYSPKITLDFLKSLNLTPSEEFIEESKKEADFFSKYVGVTRRFASGDFVEQDVLFDRKVKLSHGYLDTYPQLRFEYKEEDGIIKKKTLEDYESDYTKYLDGEITWNGDREVICAMYEERISVLKEKKGSTY